MRQCPNCHESTINAVKVWRRCTCPACGEVVIPKYQSLVVLIPLILTDVLFPWRAQAPAVQQMLRKGAVAVLVCLGLALASRAWVPLQVLPKGNPLQYYSTNERRLLVGVWVLLFVILALADLLWPGRRGF